MYFLVNRQRISVPFKPYSQHFSQANFLPKSSHSYQRKLLKTRTPSRNKNQRSSFQKTRPTSMLTRTVSCKERANRQKELEPSLQRGLNVYNASQFFQLRKQLINLQNNFVTNSRPENLRIHELQLLLTILDQRIGKISASLHYFSNKLQFADLAKQLQEMLHSYQKVQQRVKMICLLNKAQPAEKVNVQLNQFQKRAEHSKIAKSAIVKKKLKSRLVVDIVKDKISNIQIRKKEKPLQLRKVHKQLAATQAVLAQIKRPPSLSPAVNFQEQFFNKLNTQLSQIPKFSSSSQRQSCRRCSQSFLEEFPDQNQHQIKTPISSSSPSNSNIQEQKAFKGPLQLSSFQNQNSSSLISIEKSQQSDAEDEESEHISSFKKVSKKKYSVNIIDDQESKPDAIKKPRRNKSKVSFQQKPTPKKAFIYRQDVKLKIKKSKRKKSEKQSDKFIPLDERTDSNSPQQVINKLMNFILHKPQGSITPIFNQALNSIKGFDKKKEFIIGMIKKFSQCLNDKALAIFKSQVKAFLEREQISLPQYVHFTEQQSEEVISNSQIQCIQRKLSQNIIKMKFMKYKQSQCDLQQNPTGCAYNGHYYSIRTQCQGDPLLLALRRSAFKQSTPSSPAKDQYAQQVGYQDQQLIRFKIMIKEVLKQYLLLRRNCKHLF